MHKRGLPEDKGRRKNGNFPVNRRTEKIPPVRAGMLAIAICFVILASGGAVGHTLPARKPFSNVKETGAAEQMSGGSGSAPYSWFVNNTLLPWNNTLLHGNVVDTGNALSVTGNPVVDNATGNIYVAVLSGPYPSYYLALVNVTTGMATALISLPASYPAGLVYDPGNGMIYATSNNNVYMINTSLNKYVGKTPDFMQTTGYTYDSSVYDSSNGNVYILESNTSGARISVLNTSLSRVTSNITSTNLTDPAETGVFMVFDASDGYIYADVTGGSFRGIDVINVNSESLVKSITAPGFGSYAVGEMLYVPGTKVVYAEIENSTYFYNISSVDVSSGTLTNNITVSTEGSGFGGIGPMAYLTSTGYVYVVYSNGTGYNISVIDPASSVILGHITGMLPPESFASLQYGLQQSDSLIYDHGNGKLYYLFSSSVGPGGFSTINPPADSLDPIAIPLGSAPSAIAYDSSGNAYVADAAFNDVFEISHATGKISTVIAVRSAPDAIAYDNADKEMFVGGSSGVISVISTVSNRVVDNITVVSGVSPPTEPAMVYDSSNGYVYAINNFGASPGTLSVISASSNTVVANISVGTDPMSVAYDSSNHYVYVTNVQSNNISVISGASFLSTFSFSFGSLSPASVYFNAVTGYLYVLSVGNLYTNISVINPSDNSILKVFNVSLTLSGDVAFGPNGSMYASVPVDNNMNGEVVVINVTSYAVVDSIQTGLGSGAIASDPLGNSLDVTNFQPSSFYGPSGSISEILFARETLYGITFVETGLPSGSEWYLLFQNSTSTHSYFSSTTSISVPMQLNGTYSYYDVSSMVDYKASPDAGSVVVNGYNQTINVTFAPFKSRTYVAEFTETGLPAGSQWYVNVSNLNLSGAITKSTYNVSLPNGTYTYVAESDNFSAPGGPLTISGHNVSITLEFHRTYLINFQETGLLRGVFWYVVLNGTEKSSQNQSISFKEANGTYLYTVGEVGGFTVSNTSGHAIVTGDAVNVSLSFVLQPHDSRPIWAFTGAYLNYSYTMVNGNFSLSGAFLITVENVNSSNGMLEINETTTAPGLRMSLVFNVSWNGVIPMAYDPSVMLFPEGLNSSVLAGINKGVSSIDGTPVTDGASLTVSTPMGKLPVDRISISTGLSVENVYYDSVSGVSPLFTYNFTGVGTNMLGSLESTNIRMSVPAYQITFSETGLSSGTLWNVKFDGLNHSSSTSTIAFSAQNGNYSYSIEAVQGYTVSVPTGNVTVSGKNVAVTVTFSSTGKSTGNGPMTIGTLEIIGAAALITAVIAAVSVILWRRR